MKPRRPQVPDSCRAVTEVLNRIGDKWSLGVVRQLGVRKMRSASYAGRSTASHKKC